MKHRHFFSHLVGLLVVLCVAACQSAGPVTVVGGDSATANQPETAPYEAFDPLTFSRSAEINNQWFPLTPGTVFTYEGITEEDGKSFPHRVVITVTDLTKVIGGVRAAVTWDRDYSEGDLVEAELAFFAQDNNGTVWRMGEYPEEYENGQFITAPSWVHGIHDARAGIAMQADPQAGTPEYSQGWGPMVDWTDRAKVDQVGQSVCVPVKCYENVLVIAETSASEPGAYQLKFYAPGVGNIKTDWRGTDQTKETLDLTSIMVLSAEELAEARAEALKLEAHAYEVSPDMYAQTMPAEYPVGTPAVKVTMVTATPRVEQPGGSTAEIVIYAADLPKSALYELNFTDDEASPGGKRIGLPNNGDELDPPPENDPHATFKVQVQSGIPYRCWIHMNVGEAKGKSTANLIWVQLSNAVDEAGNPVYRLGSKSYLTAQGPTQTGWAWTECTQNGAGVFLYFNPAGEITIRLQAGMEGVSFDQFVLSSAKYLGKGPVEAIVEK